MFKKTNGFRVISHNKRGAVLIAIALLSLVMMIVAVGIITLNSSQSLSNRKQIDRIRAEQAAQGAFWYNYMSQTINSSPDVPDAEVLDNKLYNYEIQSSGSGPDGTTAYEITVNYTGNTP